MHGRVFFLRTRVSPTCAFPVWKIPTKPMQFQAVQSVKVVKLSSLDPRTNERRMANPLNCSRHEIKFRPILHAFKGRFALRKLRSERDFYNENSNKLPCCRNFEKAFEILKASLCSGLYSIMFFFAMPFILQDTRTHTEWNEVFTREACLVSLFSSSFSHP